jgi:hypothetical protein
MKTKHYDRILIFKISINQKDNLKTMAISYEKSLAQILRDLIDKEYKVYLNGKKRDINTLQVVE